MRGFFQSIGRGILYFLTPFAWIIGMAVGGIVALVVFFVYVIYLIILFFTGRNLFKDLPEDEKAKAILAAQADAALAQAQAPQQPQTQTQVYMNNPQVNLYQNPGYPYPPQGQPNPYQYQQQQQPTVSVQVNQPLPPQPEPIEMRPSEQVEETHEENTPAVEETKSDYYEEPTEEINIQEDYSEDEIEEYAPKGGDIFERDLRDDDND